MIDPNSYQKIVDDAKKSLGTLVQVQDDIFKKLADVDPALFEEMSKDLDKIRSSKDILELNNLSTKYANLYRK
jgi:hypothetical protein